MLDALVGLARNASNTGEQALLETLQKALFGVPLESLGRELPAEKSQIW